MLKCIVTFENVCYVISFFFFLVFFHYDWLAVSPHAPLCLYRMAADRVGGFCAFVEIEIASYGLQNKGQYTAIVKSLLAFIPARYVLNFRSQLGIPAHKGSPRYGAYRRRKDE